MHTIHLQHIRGPDRLIVSGPHTQGQRLAAFLITEITGVHDEEVYAKYRDAVSPNLAAAGGTYLVRGGPVEVLEGNWHPKRIVVVRFDSVEAARRWWKDSAYAELKAMRQRSTDIDMILVEGVPNAY
jgi:uncharacterized protein (DUF1330 family)